MPSTNNHVFRSPHQALLGNYSLVLDDGLFTPPGPDIHILEPHPFRPLQQLPTQHQQYENGQQYVIDHEIRHAEGV